MLDIRYISENTEAVKNRFAGRNGTFPVDEAVALDKKRKEALQAVEVLKARRNSASEQVSKLKREGKDASEIISQTQKLGDEIKALDETVKTVEEQLYRVMLTIPNLPHESVPKGKGEEENKAVRTVGTPAKFNFTPKPHWEIGENLNILDFPRAGKITGARFAVYKGLAAKLERAIINFMLDTHGQAGYTEVFPPFMVNLQSMIGTGQYPKFVESEGAFTVKNTDYFLVPTAEVPVTNMHRDEILDVGELPVKYCAYTACFRAEAGSAGRDTRGLIRQHQFNKVELVKFAHPDDSYNQLETLTNDAEKILQLLGLPYRVSLLCTGDMGFCSAKTYDIEVWMPSYDRYVEISSCTNFEDFQARRANIRFRREKGAKPQFVHTINGSGLAAGRTTAAILENFQNADGSVTVPEVLRKYMKETVIR